MSARTSLVHIDGNTTRKAALFLQLMELKVLALSNFTHATALRVKKFPRSALSIFRFDEPFPAPLNAGLNRFHRRARLDLPAK